MTLSNGAMRIQVYANSHSAVTATCSKRARTAIIPFVVQNTAPQVSFMKDLAAF